MMLFRKILFYCFLLLYATLCPLLIFYTLGYRFDLKHDRGIVKTGAFSVTTLPEGAEVKIENHRTQQKTPAVILNLQSGHYGVQIQKEGYQVWQNQIQIEAERAVVVEKIILLPSDLKPETAAQGPFKKIAVFKEGTLAFVLRGERLEDATVLDLTKNTEYILGPAALSSAFRKSRVEEVYTEPNSGVFWLWLDGGRMLQGRIRFGTLDLEDWSRYFSEKPEDLQWDPNMESQVYASHGDTLRFIDLERGAAHVLTQDLHGYRVYKQRVFISQERGVFRTDSEGQHARPLLDDPVLAAELFGDRDNFQMGVYPGGNLIFLDSKGALFTNRLPYWIARRGIRGYEYDTLSSQAAIWTENKIGVLDFSRDSFLREEAFERKVRKRWIYRRADHLLRVIWAVDGTQLIFQDGRQVYLLETARGLEARPRFIAQADPDLPLVFSESQGTLYYADPESKNWMALRLVPKRELLGEAFSKAGLSEPASARPDFRGGKV